LTNVGMAGPRAETGSGGGGACRQKARRFQRGRATIRSAEPQGLQKSLPTPRFEERDQSDLPDRPRQRRPGQFEELPLLVLVLAEEAEFDEVLGASELRRLPQGSAGFASGIFLSDSL
jgi:hypothetical protein